MNLTAAILTTSLLTACSFSPVSQAVKSEIAYGEHALQTVDVYIPNKSTKNTPVAISVHGGFWNSGEKAAFVEIVRDMQARGIAVFNMNYRLAPKTTISGMLEDIDSVVTMVRANTTNEYNPNNITLIGVSSGAHLALLYGYKNPTKIQHIAALAAPTDLNALYNSLEASHPIIDAAVGKNDAVARQDASPINYTSNPSALPTTYLFHCKNDDVVPVSQVEKLYELIKSSAKHRLYAFDQSPCQHAFADFAVRVEVFGQLINLVNSQP